MRFCSPVKDLSLASTIIAKGRQRITSLFKIFPTIVEVHGADETVKAVANMAVVS